MTTKPLIPSPALAAVLEHYAVHAWMGDLQALDRRLALVGLLPEQGGPAQELRRALSLVNYGLRSLGAEPLASADGALKCRATLDPLHLHPARDELRSALWGLDRARLALREGIDDVLWAPLWVGAMHDCVRCVAQVLDEPALRAFLYEHAPRDVAVRVLAEELRHRLWTQQGHEESAWLAFTLPEWAHMDVAAAVGAALTETPPRELPVEAAMQALRAEVFALAKE